MNFIRFFITLLIFCFSAASHAALDIQHWQTSQGTRVYFVENHNLPIIDLKVNFYAGSAYESADKAGVAGITRYMMKLGAAGKTDEEIEKGFADVGAIMGGGAGADATGFGLRTLSSEQEKQASLNLFKQVLQQPDFPAEVLAREKARIIAGIQESATKPSSIKRKAFSNALYGDHVYANGAKRTEATVSSLTRDDLLAFYQHYYSANNAVLAMIGDMTLQEAKQVAESLMTGLPEGKTVNPIPAVENLKVGQTIYLPHPATQAHVKIGAPGIKLDEADRLALTVGNYILGGGSFESRLTKVVREEHGLVYGIYSYFSPMIQRGPFAIGFETKKSQVTQALALVNQTVNDFIEKGVTASELKAAKANIIGGFPMKIDSNKKILGYLSTIGFYQLPLTYLDEYNDKIAAITASQIKAAFQKHLDPKNFVTVIVGLDKPEHEKN